MEDQNNTNFVNPHNFYSKRYLKVHMTTYEGLNCLTSTLLITTSKTAFLDKLNNFNISKIKKVNNMINESNVAQSEMILGAKKYIT